MLLSFKRTLAVGVMVLLVLTTTVARAAEEKQSITGHIYCVLPTAEGVKLEPGVCPGGDHPHVLKTKDGKLVLLQESSILKDIPKLTAEEKKNVTIEGKMTGNTTFTPEAVKWPWLNR